MYTLLYASSCSADGARIKRMKHGTQNTSCLKWFLFGGRRGRGFRVGGLWNWTVIGPGPTKTKSTEDLGHPSPHRVLAKHCSLGGSIWRPELLFNNIMMIQGGKDPRIIMATLEQMDQ